MSDAELLELQAELDELERTDPDVHAAAESYDRMVERVTGRVLPARPDVDPCRVCSHGSDGWHCATVSPHGDGQHTNAAGDAQW